MGPEKEELRRLRLLIELFHIRCYNEFTMSVKEVIDKFAAEYRFLSNFYPAKVKLDGLEYKTLENAYQAAKNFDLERRKMFLTLNAKQAKDEGQKTLLRPDWHQVKILVMTNLVRDKFSNNPELCAKLLETGDAELIEGNTWGDTFWGVCKGKGENHLGKILMKVRQELRDGAVIASSADHNHTTDRFNDLQKVKTT